MNFFVFVCFLCLFFVQFGIIRIASSRALGKLEGPWTLNQGPGCKFTIHFWNSWNGNSGQGHAGHIYLYSPQTCPYYFAVRECTVDKICILPEPSYKTLLSWFQISWFHSLSFRYDWRFATLQTTTLFSHRLLHLCNTLQSLFWPKGRRIRYASDVIDGQGKEGENNDNQKEQIQGCLHGDLVPQSCLTKSSQYFLAVVNHFFLKQGNYADGIVFGCDLKRHMQ